MASKKFETKAIRTQLDQTHEKEHSTPLYLTSSFTFDSPELMADTFAGETQERIYSRFDNPNFSEFTEKLCLLEGAEAGFATASGMAAVFGTFGALASSGDHIISCRSIFGSTHGVFTKHLPRFGITTSYVEYNKPEDWYKAIQPTSKFLYLESPTNPGLDIVDMEAAGKFADEHGLILVVDNCFATPYIQRPIEFGAHLVVHSATKFIDGQGRVVGGAVVGKADLIEEIRLFCRSTGPSLSPFNAWVLSKSLETLAVRMERHCSNALSLAESLLEEASISWVKYPLHPTHPQYDIAKKQMSAGGALVSFELKGGLDAGKKFLNNIQMCSLTANLGDTRTIVTHPASTTHSKLSEEERLAAGITPGMVRISVGLEHIDDIKEDILSALKK